MYIFVKFVFEFAVVLRYNDDCVKEIVSLFTDILFISKIEIQSVRVEYLQQKYTEYYVVF